MYVYELVIKQLLGEEDTSLESVLRTIPNSFIAPIHLVEHITTTKQLRCLVVDERGAIKVAG